MKYVYRLPDGSLLPVTANPKPAGRVIVRVPLADYRAMLADREASRKAAKP